MICECRQRKRGEGYEKRRTPDGTAAAVATQTLRCALARPSHAIRWWLVTIAEKRTRVDRGDIGREEDDVGSEEEDGAHSSVGEERIAVSASDIVDLVSGRNAEGMRRELVPLPVNALISFEMIGLGLFASNDAPFDVADVVEEAISRF